MSYRVYNLVIRPSAARVETIDTNISNIYGGEIRLARYFLPRGSCIGRVEAEIVVERLAGEQTTTVFVDRQWRHLSVDHRSRTDESATTRRALACQSNAQQPGDVRFASVPDSLLPRQSGRRRLCRNMADGRRKRIRPQAPRPSAAGSHRHTPHQP